MEKVTGQDVLDLARKIVIMCIEHTPAEAIAATEIAGKVIASRLYSSQSPEASSLSAATRK